MRYADNLPTTIWLMSVSGGELIRVRRSRYKIDIVGVPVQGIQIRK